MMPKQGEASVERGFIRCPGTFVLHRDPQIDREWLRREGADLRDRVADRVRCRGVGAKRPKAAEIRHRRGQLLRLQSPERPLDNRVLDPERGGEAVVTPGSAHRTGTSKISSRYTGVPSGRLATPDIQRHRVLSLS